MGISMLVSAFIFFKHTWELSISVSDILGMGQLTAKQYTIIHFGYRNRSVPLKLHAPFRGCLAQAAPSSSVSRPTDMCDIGTVYVCI